MEKSSEIEGLFGNISTENSHLKIENYNKVILLFIGSKIGVTITPNSKYLFKKDNQFSVSDKPPTEKEVSLQEFLYKNKLGRLEDINKELYKAKIYINLEKLKSEEISFINTLSGHYFNNKKYLSVHKGSIYKTDVILEGYIEVDFGTLFVLLLRTKDIYINIKHDIKLKKVMGFNKKDESLLIKHGVLYYNLDCTFIKGFKPKFLKTILYLCIKYNKYFLGRFYLKDCKILYKKLYGKK